MIFDKSPEETITCNTYCTIGELGSKQFKIMIQQFPYFKDNMIDKFINNPYDEDRDFFVKIVQKHISYL